MTEQDATTRGPAAPGSFRVIVVDDSASARQLISATLRRAGFEIEEAVDAAEALRLTRLRPPDAVVTDLWMPGISGTQLCRLLRSETTLGWLPVVVLTAAEDRRSSFSARAAGVSGYLLKSELARLPPLLDALVGAAPVSTAAPSVGAAALPIEQRLSALLDTALFDATLRGALRTLAGAEGDVDELFALLSTVVAGVLGYRWLALREAGAATMRLHTHTATVVADSAQAATSLGLGAEASPGPLVDRRPTGTTRGPVRLHTVSWGGEVVGTLAVGLCAKQRGADDDGVFSLVVEELGAPLRLCRLLADTRRLGLVDSLTQLMNRRAFLDAVEREQSRWARHGLPFSLLMIDIDHFKRVNDVHGHATGDEVLRAIAKELARLARKSDLVARWGGEEFVVGLPHTGAMGARVAGERMRQGIAQAAIRLPNGDLLPVTASVGVASVLAELRFDDLMRRADAALYAAKHRGRNVVAVG